MYFRCKTMKCFKHVCVHTVVFEMKFDVFSMSNDEIFPKAECRCFRGF